MTFQEIRIIATGHCITNQLRDVNTICRRSWYIAAYIWKIYDFKIEVITFIINFSTELTTVVKFEVKKWCGLYFHFPAYGVYISQLIRYAMASSNYSDFLKCHLYLRNRLLYQGYKKTCLIRSLEKFIFRYQDLVEKYSVSAETIINDGFS
jgi:hypothetical protein